MPARRNDGLYTTIMILFGAAMVVFTCLVEIPSALGTRNWNRVQATVTQAQVVTEESGEPTGGQRSFARIDFTYDVAGKRHKGYWEPRKVLGMWGAPGSIVAETPSGSSLTIYHSPVDPSVFVMQQGLTVRLIVQVVVGVLILTFGTYRYWVTQSTAPEK